MPLFVHLAPGTAAPRIAANGVRRSRARAPLPSGVYAMPVGRSFVASHQWLRELKRSGARSIVGVYFRLADAEPVWLGHFGRPHALVTASEAAAALEAAADPMGLEVLVPRRVEAREIVRVKELPQVTGWRYYPGAHGCRPCSCPACLPKGEIRSRRIREREER